MNGFATGNVVNVSPISDALYGLVLSSGISNSGKVTVLASTTIADLRDIVEDLVMTGEVELNGSSANTLSDALKVAARKDEESYSRLINAFGAAEISGTIAVESPNGQAVQPCAGVTILIEDFGNIVTRYKTKTDSNGKFSARVQRAGNYIIGAMNDGATCTGGSQWWASPSGVVKQLSAAKVTVGANQIVTKDFILPVGGRIQGTVKAKNNGLPIAGVTMKVKDFLNTQTVAKKKTNIDGSYIINLAPGNYFLMAENKTTQPYATEAYSQNNGASFSEAELLTVDPGIPRTIDFTLEAGKMVSGLVSDPVAGPISGMHVRFDDSDEKEHADVIRTDLQGNYRIWLMPDFYRVLARGQMKEVDLTSTNKTADFSDAVGEIKMVIQDQAGKPIGGAKPRFRSKVNFDILSKEASNGDGSASLYSTLANMDNNLLEVKIDDGGFIGSSIYIGKTRLIDGDPIPVMLGGVTNLGTVTLPAGGVLTGKVTVGGIPPKVVVKIQVRNGGKGSGNRFTTTRTMSDGTYSISLPAGTYTRVCAFTGSSASICPSSGSSGSGGGSGYAYIDNVAITANETKPVSFALP